MNDHLSPHPALKHLQITFTPEKYQAFLYEGRQNGKWPMFAPGDASPAYWQGLPTYVFARCPFCGGAYTSLLDTHSLDAGGKTYREDDRSVFAGHSTNVGCGHFVALQKFVNLNGLVPLEVGYFNDYLDVPFISPRLVPDDVPTYAVMHSLPLCRLEEGVFVPRYAVYTIAYYSQEPLVMRKRGAIEPLPPLQGDNEGYHGTVFFYSRGLRPEWYDLRLWVERKKLQWLDPASDNLALKAGPPEAFPYVNIEGFRRPFQYRDGQLKFRD